MKTKIETQTTFQLQRAAKGGGFEDMAGRYENERVAREVLVGRHHEATATNSGDQFRLVEIKKRIIA